MPGVEAIGSGDLVARVAALHEVDLAGLGLGGTEQLVVDVLVVVPVASGGSLVEAKIGVPEHDTAKRGAVLEAVDLGHSSRGLEVVPLVGALESQRRGRKTDEDLGTRALRGLDVVLPANEVDAVAADAALLVVVELNKKRIEFGVLDDVVHLEEGVIQGALGGGRDHVRLLGVSGKQLAHAPDKLDVSILVGELGLDVQVEAVNHRLGLGRVLLVEWSGLGPGRLVRAKRTPHEIGKLGALCFGRERVVDPWQARVTTDREQHLLSPLLAEWDIFGDEVAVGEKPRVLAIGPVETRSAVGTKVGSGIAGAGRVLLGSRDDERDGDDLEPIPVAEVPKLLNTITFLAPVEVDGLRVRANRQSRKGKG